MRLFPSIGFKYFCVYSSLSLSLSLSPSMSVREWFFVCVNVAKMKHQQ